MSVSLKSTLIKICIILEISFRLLHEYAKNNRKYNRLMHPGMKFSLLSKRILLIIMDKLSFINYDIINKLLKFNNSL